MAEHDTPPGPDLLTDRQLANIREAVELNGGGELAQYATDLLDGFLLERDALRSARDRNAELESERDAIRELMNTYNLGGWTDAIAPMQRALKSEARNTELERLLALASQFRTPRGFVQKVLCGEWMFVPNDESESGSYFAGQQEALDAALKKAEEHPDGP